MAFKAIKTFGKSFGKTTLLSAMLVGAGITAIGGTAIAAEKVEFDYKMVKKDWSFNGLFGTYDREAMQRGYQVYKQVCASCHHLKHLSFRHLGDPGGPFHDEKYPNPSDNPMVKIFAAEFENVRDIDPDTGEQIMRPGIPADKFPWQYANAAEAASLNGGAVPPDLSVMAKARTDGANYIYNLLVAYDEPMPEGMSVGAGKYFNPVMAGGVIAMAPQLTDGLVEYEGENAPEATVSQMASDVTHFLAWSADPKLAQRKRVGFGTMLYLFFLSILLYLSYRKVWANVKH